MKLRICLCIGSLLGFFHLPALGQKLKIQQLVGDYYVFTTYKQVEKARVAANGLYVVGPEGVLLIDVPWDETQTKPLLDSIQRRHGKRVLYSLSTHFHNDRTAGLDVLAAAGVKTFSSLETKRLCRKHKEAQAQYAFQPDTVFQIGPHTLQIIYPGPGHSDDNLVVYAQDEQILYGGCLVKSSQAKDLGNLEDADRKAWPATIRSLQRMYPDRRYVVPGHDGWADAKGLEHTLALLKK